jgi:DNA-binding MarR family transcriptional regulator
MSKMVSSLVERGLLTRTQDPENRRLVRIEITPEGEEIFLTVLGRVQRRIAEWLVPISSEERETIVQALERLVTLFAAEGEVRQHLPLPIVTDIP